MTSLIAMEGIAEGHRSFEEDKAPNEFTTRLIVPFQLREGDSLSSIQFNLFGENFYCFGRYNPGDDTLEFVLCGERGIRFKMSVSGESTWTVKRHGITKTSQDDLCIMDSVLTTAHDNSRQLFQSGINFQVERIQAEAFDREDILRVPYAQIRDSSLDVLSSTTSVRRESYVGPWSFHGRSFPDQFWILELNITLNRGETTALDQNFRLDEVLFCSSPAQAQTEQCYHN